MGFFDNIGKVFGGGQKNPADSANQYLNQIPGAVNPYYQPYINQGQQSNQILQGQYGQLTSDPGALYSKFGQGYKESPGYQFKLSQALQSGNNAAAAGGMAGSPSHQQNNMQLGNDIASQDYNDYMKQILGLYGLGLEGEKGLGEQGFKASTGYGDILGSNLGAQAQYGYAGQAGKNANQSNTMNNYLKLASMGLGFLAGGPMGAGAAGALAGPMSGSQNSPWSNPG